MHPDSLSSLATVQLVSGISLKAPTAKAALNWFLDSWPTPALVRSVQHGQLCPLPTMHLAKQLAAFEWCMYLVVRVGVNGVLPITALP